MSQTTEARHALIRAGRFTELELPVGMMEKRPSQGVPPVVKRVFPGSALERSQPKEREPGEDG